jgi:phosphoribosylaminoimidazole carboxylase (NCAIR synthetase)
VLCVEFFVVNDGSEDGALVVDEMAPRPHNSGHYTMDACDVSQFALQVHAVAGLPLPAPRQHSSAALLNLLGDVWFDVTGQARTPDQARLLYGHFASSARAAHGLVQTGRFGTDMQVHLVNDGPVTLLLQS